MAGCFLLGSFDWAGVEAVGTIVVGAIVVAVARARRRRRKFYGQLQEAGRLIDWPAAKRRLQAGDGLLLLSWGWYFGVWYIAGADGGDDSCPLPAMESGSDPASNTALANRSRSREALAWCERHCSGDTGRAVLVDTRQSTIRREMADLPAGRVRLVWSGAIDPMPPASCA